MTTQGPGKNNQNQALVLVENFRISTKVVQCSVNRFTF